MKIHYAGIMYNDFVDGFKGTCLSFWTQGCPHHCDGCQNPETWDFNSGIEREYNEVESIIINHINDNGILRNLSILGGEPLCDKNIDIVHKLVYKVREIYPKILIFIWTGDLYEDLINREVYRDTLSKIDYLIDGPYIKEQRDLTLLLRGSKNQRVIDIKETMKQNKIITVK